MIDWGAVHLKWKYNLSSIFTEQRHQKATVVKKPVFADVHLITSKYRLSIFYHVHGPVEKPEKQKTNQSYSLAWPSFHGNIRGPPLQCQPSKTGINWRPLTTMILQKKRHYWSDIAKGTLGFLSPGKLRGSDHPTNPANHSNRKPTRNQLNANSLYLTRRVLDILCFNLNIYSTRHNYRRVFIIATCQGSNCSGFFHN